MRRVAGIMAGGIVLLTTSLAQDSPVSGLRMDVESYRIDLELVPENAFIKGTTVVRFKVLEDAISLPFELNSRISLIQVVDETGDTLSPSFDSLNSSRMLVRSENAFKAGTERQLTFTFDGTLEPEDYAYLDNTPRPEKAVISQEGALLLDEGLWFPSHELRVDPATFEIRVSVPLGFTVVGPGLLQPIETLGVNEVFTWRNNVPQSNLPVSVARYFRQQFEEGLKIPVTFFAREDFRGDIRPYVEEVNRIVEFLQSEFGPLPELERLNLVDVGNVNLPSTGSLGLMLLESTVLRPGSPPLMELARRTALQWWSYARRISRPQDVWLQDGFADYAAVRYIETAYPDRFETELARLAVEALKYEERAPVANGLTLGWGSPQYRSVVGAKGAWVLYMLRQLVGDDLFPAVLKQWFVDRGSGTATTMDFVDLVNRRTESDYNWFFIQWLESTGVPEFDIEYRVLKQTAGGFKIRGQIKQEMELFRMPIDIRIETKGQPEEKHLRITGKSTSFTFETETMPLRLEMDPHGKILRDSGRMRVAVDIAIGEEYQEQGDYVSALREFDKAQELNPRSSYAHYRLGETYFLQHSYNNAANSFRDALNGDLQPFWVETWTNIHLGKIYDILGQRERAKAEYTKALNSKVDYNGAQEEAEKYLNEPFSKPRTLIN